MSMTQTEADYLIALPKRFVENDPVELGTPEKTLKRELASLDGRERSLFDAWSSGARLGNYTLQNRARTIVILVRVDVGETLEHTNPDGVLVSGPHIHMYREGYDDKFASPLDQHSFHNSADIVITFQDFAQFCRIQDLPPIVRRLI